VAVLPAAGVSKADLAEAMVGRSVAPAARRSHAAGGLVAELQAATVRGSGPRPLLDRAELTLHGGEIVAVAGVAGNGQQTLAEVLCGEVALDAGSVAVEGHNLPARPRRWVQAGVARIPEDRHAVGVVGDLPLWENAVLERYASPAFARAGVMKRGRAMAHARRLVERFDVRGTEGAGLATVTRSLSGGNMQKLILGRALLPPPGAPMPRLIVAHQPTWGLDVGAVDFVQRRLLQARDAGAAVLLISDDLDEVLAMGDRIAVMHEGRIVGDRPARDWTRDAIGLAMAGGADAARAA